MSANQKQILPSRASKPPWWSSAEAYLELLAVNATKQNGSDMPFSVPHSHPQKTPHKKKTLATGCRKTTFSNNETCLLWDCHFAFVETVENQCRFFFLQFAVRKKKKKIIHTQHRPFSVLSKVPWTFLGKQYASTWVLWLGFHGFLKGRIEMWFFFKRPITLSPAPCRKWDPLTTPVLPPLASGRQLIGHYLPHCSPLRCHCLPAPVCMQPTWNRMRYRVI